MQGHHIRNGQQLVEAHLTHAIAFQLGFCRSILEHHGHAESTRDATYCLPDASHADDAHRLACQLHERRVPEREVLGARPVAFHDQIGMLSYMQAQLQQQRERHLRHVGRGVGGHVRYDHARIARCVEIHHVVAGGGECDHLEARSPAERLGVPFRLARHDDVGFGYPSFQLVARRAVVHGDGAEPVERVPAQVAGVVHLSFEDHDVHRRSFPRKGSARGEGSSTGPQGGDDAAPIGCRSALRGKQMQTEKEGSLSFAEAIIKVDIEYHMMHECMFCELGALKVTDR